MLALFVFHWPELSMFLITGVFLATTFLWVLVTDAVVLRTMRSGQMKLSRGSMVLVLGVGFSIFLALLALLFVGETVTWWAARVNAVGVPYHVMGIDIPKMLSSLASAFFTSIVLLTWTVGKDVARTANNLQDAELNHANPGLLLKQREDAISRILSSVGMKGIMFIAVIGITIILSSDLIYYLGQGLTIILPFVIGTLATLAANVLWQRFAPKSGEDVLFDHLTACPACGADTGLGGLFCENCGAKLIGGTRVDDGRACPQCQLLNPASGKHCRFCGTLIGAAESEGASQPVMK